MTLASEIVGRRMGLPVPQTRDVICEPDLRIAMDDGTVLLADRWVARSARERPQPTVLVRSPYGRRQAFGFLFGRLLAERGLQVVIQSVRGTFGSGGEFSPFDERADGLATLRWLRSQPWHAGGLGMFGPSYLGLVQWAVAPEAGDDLAALAIQVSASQFHGQTYAGGSLSLETAASWLVLVAMQERRFAALAMLRGLRRLATVIDAPLEELDARATGAVVTWFREALASTQRSDPYWVARDFAAGVEQVSAPVQLIGGWYDIFLPWMLEDFAALQAAGRAPQLIIGPWTHTSPGLMRAGLRDGIGWLRSALLHDDRLARRAPVRILVTGERSGGGWRDLAQWPPPDTGERKLWLAEGGALRDAPPLAAGVDAYHYDPAAPTPSLGGPVLLAREPVVDNRPLEARPDVLTFDSAPLPAVVEAIGPVRIELHVRASAPQVDVFARVCDVDADGASWNVCDALARATPGPVAFDLWPMGHRFAAGHRIRLQVSSGAHPRYARPPAAIDVEILHGPEHPSALVLPRS